MVCKFKFVRYVPRFNFTALRSSNCPIFKQQNLVDFQALDPTFHLALEPKILKLESSSFGNRQSIKRKKYPEPSVLNHYSERLQEKGLTQSGIQKQEILLWKPPHSTKFNIEKYKTVDCKFQ